MDRYIDRVLIRTQGSGTRYDGRVWYELLSSIRSVNGTTVMQGQLKKSTLNQGDRVSLEYHGRTYHGIVDVEASTNPNVTEIWIKSLEMPEEIPDVQPADSSGRDSATATEPLAPEHLLRQLETSRIATTSIPERNPRQPAPDTDTESELERKLQGAGVRASLRKRKKRVGQDTPPKKQAKKMKAGTCCTCAMYVCIYVRTCITQYSSSVYIGPRHCNHTRDVVFGFDSVCMVENTYKGVCM